MESDIDNFSLETIQKTTMDAQVLREILREEEAKDIIRWIIFEIKKRAGQGCDYFSYTLHGKKCNYASYIQRYFKNKGFSVTYNPSYLVDQTVCITIDWAKRPAVPQKRSLFKKFFNLEK